MVTDTLKFGILASAFVVFPGDIRPLGLFSGNKLDGTKIYTNEQDIANTSYRFDMRFISLSILTCAFLFATAQTYIPKQHTSVVPPVALIGEYEEAFARLAEENPGILLGVCGNDMDIAYEKWSEMCVAMEDYAESIAYDIDGLKTYLYIFWNADGSFQHLAFYPKANSRNIPTDELTAFFKGFIKEYKMTIRAGQGYSHYGSASFPTHARPEYRANRD